MHFSDPKVKFRCIAILLLVTSPYLQAAPQTLKYTYDALGRVTFVEDTVNGNRDYDYDAAGNRTQVVLNQAVDEVYVPTVPPKPTNLNCSSIAPGVNRGAWTGSTEATYYLYTAYVSGNSVIFRTDRSSYTPIDNSSCRSVQACNDVGCSASVNF